MNAVAALDLVIALLLRTQQIAALIKAAQAEGRNLSNAELDQIVADNDAARQSLVDAINRART